MINAAMFFALGFLSAGLLMLIFGPAMWRRAVRLTRRAVEATSPMTLAEAKAARDQLRAEYAVQTRRLELGAAGLRERMVRQELEVTHSREALKAANLERDDMARALRDIEEREAALRRDLVNKQEEIARLSARLRESERNLERRSQQVAHLSALNATGEAGAGANGPAQPPNVNMAINELEDEIAGHKARHTADATRILRLESEIATLKRQLAELEAQRTAPNGQTAAPTAAIQKLESVILDLESQKVESQAEITRLSLQYEALRGAAGDNVDGVLTSLEAENNALADELNRLSVEHDALRRRIDKLSESEDRETGLLRENITDLAAEIVALTASVEGDGATDAILNAGGKANGADEPDGRASLADRIRALRQQAKAPEREGAG